MLSKLNMEEVRQHYLERQNIHTALKKAFDARNASAYVPLALGITNSAGNYSAAEHGLGKKIMASNTQPAIFGLAEALSRCSTPRKIPKLIYDQNLKYLKISVGSEISMMLRPDKFWVANIRTIWAHLLIETGDDYQRANDALAVYRDPDGETTSEIEYSKWTEIHALLETNLKRLHELGVKEAKRQGITPGELTYLWADALANALYTARNSS